jgi:hypothetical protein
MKTQLRERDNGFFVSARIRSVDLGLVSDERFAGTTRSTLGANAGNLSGPLTVIHFGYQWLQ